MACRIWHLSTSASCVMNKDLLRQIWNSPTPYYPTPVYSFWNEFNISPTVHTITWTFCAQQSCASSCFACEQSFSRTGDTGVSCCGHAWHCDGEEGCCGSWNILHIQGTPDDVPIADGCPVMQDQRKGVGILGTWWGERLHYPYKGHSVCLGTALGSGHHHVHPFRPL